MLREQARINQQRSEAIIRQQANSAKDLNCYQNSFVQSSNYSLPQSSQSPTKKSLLYVHHQRVGDKRDLSASLIQCNNNYGLTGKAETRSVKSRDNSEPIAALPLQMNGKKEQDMAAYYERQVSGMSAKRIKEMPSKEFIKIQNLNNAQLKDSSISPIKAMMICKPPDDSTQKFQQRGSTGATCGGSSTNRGSMKGSNRQSMLDSEKGLQMTPQQKQNSQSKSGNRIQRNKSINTKERSQSRQNRSSDFIDPSGTKYKQNRT